MFVAFADQASTTNMNLISHACMLQKGCYIPRNFIPSKYTRLSKQKMLYTIVGNTTNIHTKAN